MRVPLAAVLGIAFYLSESFLGWRRHSARTEGGSRSEDGGTMRTLWATAMLSIAAGVMVSLWRVGPGLPAGVPWGWVGAAVFVLGAAFRWWSIVHLGKFFTVDIAVARDHRVVDSGPYRRVRHPSYTGLLLQYVGWALSLNSVLALPVVLVPMFVSLWYRMRAEEAVLTGALGEAYSAYCLRTKRLVPWVY